MRPGIFSALVCCALGVAGARADPAQDTKIDAAVLRELAKRSSLPESNIRALLANCDANQQSLNMCAWRDQIAAQRSFRAAVARKERELSACRADIEHRAAVWEGRRDRSCAKQAQKEYGAGSLRPTAQAICLTEQTRKLTVRMRGIHACPSEGTSP